MTRLLTVFALCLTFLLSALPAKADEAQVRGYVDQLAGQAMGILKAPGDKAGKQAQLETLFKQSVDIPWIARFVLGRHWNSATPAQQQQYVANYETFLVRNYTKRLTQYTDEGYKVTGVRQESGGTYAVSVEITQPDGPSIYTDYRIRDTNGSLKVVDIVIEGVSLVTTQRSEFDSVVQRKGLDFLIGRLASMGAPAK